MKAPQNGQEKQGTPRDLARLLSYVEPHKARLAVALLSLLIGSALGLAFPLVVRFLVDAAFIEHNSEKLNKYSLILVGVFVGQAFFTFIRSYLLSYTGERIVADLRTQVYAHLIRLPVPFFADRRVGELTSRLASDVSVVQTITTTRFTELVRLCLVLVGGVTMIAITNTRLTLLLLILAPVLVLSSAAYGRYVRRLSTGVQDRLADSNALLQETLSAIRIVKSFVREEYECRRYGKSINDSFRLAVRRSVAGAGFVASIILVVFTGISTLLWLGSRMVMSGESSLGNLIAFVLYAFSVGAAMGELSEIYGGFQQAIGSTRRIFELLDMKPEVIGDCNAKHLKQVRGRVQFNHVHFTYPDDRGVEVLHDITIDALPGELIALVGPSGAGKSTLISLIPRFYDVTSGAILIDGEDVRDAQLDDVREAIALVPQETVLFGGTIRENIAYGDLDAPDVEIQAAARAANVDEFTVSLPDAYDTVVGERGVKLSGGQRQRVAIARALLKDPAVLILDEATSSLDSESEQLVQDALETLMQGRTTFVIAHRLSTVRDADRIIVLDRGRIVEEGTHEELLINNRLYRQLYEIQFKDSSSHRPSIPAPRLRPNEDHYVSSRE